MQGAGRMTRRQFEALAEMVRTFSMDGWGTSEATEYKVRSRFAASLASICELENPRFNADKFYRACGLPELAAN